MPSPGLPPAQCQAHPCIEVEVLFHGHVVEEDVVLGTQPQAAADQDHVLGDLVAVDVGLAARRGVQPCGEWDTVPQGDPSGKSQWKGGRS